MYDIYEISKGIWSVNGETIHAPDRHEAIRKYLEARSQE